MIRQEDNVLNLRPALSIPQTVAIETVGVAKLGISCDGSTLESAIDLTEELSDGKEIFMQKIPKATQIERRASWNQRFVDLTEDDPESVDRWVAVYEIGKLDTGCCEGVDIRHDTFTTEVVMFYSDAPKALHHFQITHESLPVLETEDASHLNHKRTIHEANKEHSFHETREDLISDGGHKDASHLNHKRTIHEANKEHSFHETREELISDGGHDSEGDDPEHLFRDELHEEASIAPHVGSTHPLTPSSFRQVRPRKSGPTPFQSLKKKLAKVTAKRRW